MFECTECKIIKLVPVGHSGTGYGVTKEGNKVCYACCAKLELASMIETGKSTLYFCKDKVTDWAGGLVLKFSKKELPDITLQVFVMTTGLEHQITTSGMAIL
jgi:hypothetical protein